MTNMFQLVFYLFCVSFCFLCFLFPQSICYKRYFPAGFEELRCHAVKKPYD